MRGRRDVAASCGSLKALGLQVATVGLLLAVAACTPLKYPPDRNAAEQTEPAAAETGVAATPETMPEEDAPPVRKRRPTLKCPMKPTPTLSTPTWPMPSR